jgi:hypothetical protein
MSDFPIEPVFYPYSYLKSDGGGLYHMCMLPSSASFYPSLPVPNLRNILLCSWGGVLVWEISLLVRAYRVI